MGPFLGFNEAAGIPRGRLLAAGPVRHVWIDASMRPRVFPAEDPRRRRSQSMPLVASMRPRVFPAEDPPRVEVRYSDRSLQ